MKKNNCKLISTIMLIWKSKLVMAMRATLFVVIISISQVFAVNTYSQSTRLSLDFKNTSVKKILGEIEDQSEFYFIYDATVIDVEKKITIESKNRLIPDILNEIFKNSNVAYKITDRQIALTSKNSTEITQQPTTVSGKITDSSGSPLPGVTVVVKGTTRGTVTSADGEYSLPNIPDDGTLVFSFVGTKTQEIEVEGRTNIDITLVEDFIGLDEVVAIGYGVVRKSDLTGSVTKVNVEEFSELSNVSVIQSLHGTVPGLNVSAVDRPGEESSLSIRGRNSLSNDAGDNAPLIVVDGSIYRGSIIDLNTADIESVDILKDASSAAIYGSQASNGVIIITTKKGMELGKPIISYSASYTFQTPSNQLRPMHAEETEKLFSDNLWLQSRLAPDYLQSNPDFKLSQYLKTLEITDGYNAGLDEDWWGGLTRNGSINNHNISLRGKGKVLDYFISGGYTGEKGFLINDDYKKYNYRANMNAKINDWMNVGFESFITSSNYSGASPSVKTAFYLQPWAPIKDDKGELVLYPEGSMLNPYTTLNVKDSDKRLNIFGNFHAEIKLPIKGLNYRINYAQNYRTANHDNFNPYEESLTGAGYKYSSIEYDWTVDNILTFIRTFNDVHSINATFLYGVEKRNGSSTDARAQNFLNGSLGYNRLQAGDPALNSITTGAWKETSLYSMGRVIYNLHNKYLITGTVRRDGFSGFGTKNKIGVFPSIAIGWIISEESYAQTFSWLNYLKLRSSYGSTGRRSVGRYDTMAKLSSAPSRVFGDGGNTTFGQYISSMENDELGWETTTGLNLGADFSIINSRIFGNIEYFSNKTKDILYDVQLPTLTGFSSTATNIGEVENHGLEFSVTGQVIRSKDFKWDMTFNFSRVRNKIVSILGSDNDGDGVEDDLVANGLFIGEPQQVIYDYEIIGMWQLDDETAGAIPAGFFPGTYKIADLSGPDGTPDGAYSAAYDKKILGYADPSYRFSISNKVSYKNFSLYMLINSVQGGKKYYFGDDSPYSSVYWSQKEQLTYVNGPAGAWDYWMPENPDAKYRRLDTSSAYAPRPYSQRNFIRLQDVSLSYSFNKSAIQKLDIENCKIFISGQNLVTITKWKGWDPETGRGFAPGMPLMRSYTIGLNVEF